MCVTDELTLHVSIICRMLTEHFGWGLFWQFILVDSVVRMKLQTVPQPLLSDHYYRYTLYRSDLRADSKL